MAITKKYYILSYLGANFSIKLPKYYDDIKTQVGLVEATDTTLATAFPATVGALKRAGAILEFVVSCKIGSSGGVVRTRRTKLICDIDSAVGAMSAVEGKQFGEELAGGKVAILNAYFAQTDKFR